MNEREIYQRIQDGDESALQELVRANMDDMWPIARSLAKGEGKWSPEDLFQEGALAMVRFAQRWEYQEGVPFTVACRQRVRGAMRDFLRRKADTLRGQNQQPLSLDATGGDSETGRTLGETLVTEESESFSLPDCLNRQEKEVLELRVLSARPMKTDEAAKKMGVSETRLLQLQRRAMRKMQEEA